MNVAKTNSACWWVGALAGTVTSITNQETREVYNVTVATLGRVSPQQLKIKAKTLTT